MIGEAHWVPFVILAVAISPVLVYWVSERRARKRYLVEETTVRCRAHDNQLVHVTLVRDRASGKPIGLRKCSAMSPDDVVRCNKGCLPKFERLNAPRAEPAPQTLQT